ncbi:MAG: NAD(P)/FAD-dependent oxidoreductase [Desulfobacterales bacterium]
MDKNVDVIVIGAGIGGLGCAALLAHAGAKVLVLERGGSIGGRCVSYRKNGCIIDAFIHMFASCEKGPFGRILDLTGMPKAVEFWHADPANKPILLFGGRSYVYPDLSVASEEDMQNTLKGFEMPEEDYQAALKLNHDIYHMPLEKTHQLDAVAYEEWLKTYSSHPALLSLHNHRSMLMGVVAAFEASAGEVIRMTQNWHLKRNLGYPMGGCQAIPDGFAAVIRNYGGHVKTGSPVASIRVENGRANGVTLKTGEEIHAKAVVSNAGLKETVQTMLPHKSLSPSYVAYVENLSCGVFGTDLFMDNFLNIKVLLKQPVVEPPVVFGIPTGMQASATAGDISTAFGYKDDQEMLNRFSIFMPIPSNMDPSLAPPGRQLLNFPGVMPDPNGDIKAHVNQRIEELDVIFPGIAENVLWWDVIKGSGIKGYSGRFQSDIIGLAQVVGQVGADRPSITSPIEGLFHVGADVGKDNIGTELAAESALRAAPIIMDYLE